MNINVETVKSDNADDLSGDVMRIICQLTSREVERLGERRGGDSIIEFVKRCLDVERDPEYVEEELALDAVISQRMAAAAS